MSAISSWISEMLVSVGARAQDSRLLFIGLDASGRTTTLYLLKLGEIVTTIPTIGFNVETVDVLHPSTGKRSSITAWDIGGCDKIRPLWRHYFKNTQGLVFFIDSNDRDRMGEARDELYRILNEDEVRDAPLLVFANKQDLPGAMKVDEVIAFLDLHRIKDRAVACMPAVATQGAGLWEGMYWIVEAIEEARPKLKALEAAREAFEKAQGPKATPEETLLEQWLRVVDGPDDEFLQALADYTLEDWGHRTHLRIAWLLLTRHGRREGMERIFNGIRLFIENSPRTKRGSGRGTTFHATLTYCWTHLVHFAIASASKPADKFKTFLMLNPQLTNGGLPLHYYSKKLLFDTAEARAKVVLPDKRPLPSITSNMSLLKAKALGKVGVPPPQPAPASDTTTFLQAARDRALPGWNHEAHLRVIWECLRLHGVSEGQERALALLARVQGAGFHFTLSHFWCQVLRRMIVHDHAPAMEKLREAAVARSRQHRADEAAAAQLLERQRREEQEARRQAERQQADQQDTRWAVDLLNSLLATTGITDAVHKSNGTTATTTTTTTTTGGGGIAGAAGDAESEDANKTTTAPVATPAPALQPFGSVVAPFETASGDAPAVAAAAQPEGEWVVVREDGKEEGSGGGAGGPALAAHSVRSVADSVLSMAGGLAPSTPSPSPSPLSGATKASPGPPTASPGKTAALAAEVAAAPAGTWLLGSSLLQSALPSASDSIPSWPALLAGQGYQAEAAKKLVLDHGHWERHYSKKVLMSDEAQRTLVLPDRKPLSSIV